jgi:2,4-dienoyl-CoA reductase-like NADH-dependent reductase (Old Yellow Enzyme family)/thioredoxin reductase
MKDLFEKYTLGNAKLNNRFVFPPIKLGYGNPNGTVTERQTTFYQQIATRGPGLIITEPVAVTADGREHPRQLCVHLPESVGELEKIVDSVHAETGAVCLHLNHGGAAANPKLIGGPPKGPSVITCVAREGNVSTSLSEQEIETILAGYMSAAQKAQEARFDVIEIQGGHGYLISQFLNSKLNQRKDRFGKDRALFAREALARVKEGAPDLPLLLRISGDEMSPELGVSWEDMVSLIKLAEEFGICALHVGMGSACFSPPWYFHHGSLPETPQIDALSRLRKQTALPLIAAGRMGRKQKIERIFQDRLADLIALGRPMLADPHLIEKWQNGKDDEVIHCGYCLQGCLHRLKEGNPLGCNLNPEIGMPPLQTTDQPMNVVVAGGGPAGMSASVYLSKRGHRVTLVERADHLGGQFNFAWQAPGKESMRDGLQGMTEAVTRSGASVVLNRRADASFVAEVRPDLLVWAAGAFQGMPDIPGLESQHTVTALEFFGQQKKMRGPRVLVIGAGRTGLEIAEKLGKEGYEVVATKRTDPIGSRMEMITRNLALMRVNQIPNVVLMPHTTVKGFLSNTVDIEQDGVKMSLEPFQTVILAFGMEPVPGPAEEIQKNASKTEVIGDAKEVKDIFSATQAGYRLAQAY